MHGSVGGELLGILPMQGGPLEYSVAMAIFLSPASREPGSPVPKIEVSY